MHSQDPHELMLLYVIDGLDPDERAAVQRLLDAGDPAAVAALAEANAVLGALPETLDPVTPDPAVRQRLIERAKGQPMNPSQATDHAKPTPTAPLAAVGVWPKLAIAAAFVLGVGLAAVVTWQVLQQQPATTGPAGGDWADVERVIDQQRDALAAQQAELDRMQDRLAQVQDAAQDETLRRTIEQQRLAIIEQQQRIGELQESVSLLVGPGVQQAEMAGGAEVPDAQGRLMWDPTTGQMRLLTRGLPALAPGETYQLWFVTRDGDPVSLGVFEVGDVAATTAAYVNTVPLVPDNVNVAAISIEPAGGSPEPGPTGPIIMTGPPKTE